MTDGRYDSRRGRFDSQRGNDRFDRSGSDDRGFIDRARDEVSSWFGDDDGGRRRDREERSGESDRFGRERSFEGQERGSRGRDDGARRPYTGQSGSAGFDDDRHRAPTAQNFDRGQTQREHVYGATGGTARHDPDYSQWRSRQIEELDRDYDEFRRENQSRFDSEFSTWRGQRQSKRQMLGQVTEHMEVVGSDDQPVGKVDMVKGDRVVLTKSDSSDGRHHAFTCSMVDRIEDNKLFLNCPAEQARRSFSTPDRDRALFERDDQGEDGPHMLNRSFSGTY